MPKIKYSSNDGQLMLSCGHIYSFEELGGNSETNIVDFAEKDHYCERCITEGRPGLPLSHELDDKFNNHEMMNLLTLKINYLKIRIRILVIRVLLKLRIPYYISYCWGFCRGFFIGK